MFAGGEAANRYREGVADKVSVELVVECRHIAGPGACVSGERDEILPESLADFGIELNGVVLAEQLPDERRKRHDLEMFLRRTETLEVVAGQVGQIARVCDV